MLQGFLQDLRHAVRTIWKQPGFAAMVVLTLAMGIGANTAIFSVLNPFLFKPMPFEDPSRLVHIFATNRAMEGFGWNIGRLSHADFTDLKGESTAFAQLGAYTYGGANLSGGEEPIGLTVGYVTGDMFDILGVQAAMGRGITPDDAVRGNENVVVLSDRVWRSNFGADPDIVGKTVRLSNIAQTVIGVMSGEFTFPYPGVRMWKPIVLDPAGQGRDRRALMGVGRLAAGESIETAQTELATIAGRLEAEYPETNDRIGVNIVTLREGLIFLFDIIRAALLAIALAVGLILLIGCVNVANLMLAKGTSRGREIALRSALGAGRMRIVRQLLTESSVLATLAGITGIAIAVVAVGPIAAVVPDDLWRSGRVEVDGATLTFAVLISLATTLFFGLIPALRTTKTDLTDALKEGGRTSSGGAKGRRMSNALVVAQLAGALVLLAGASLLINAVRAMQRLDTGFVPDQVLTSRILLSRSAYEDDASLWAFYREVTQNLESAPGVVATGAMAPLPFNFESHGRGFSIPGHEASQTGEPIAAGSYHITPGLLRAMGTTLLAGRDFTTRDDESAPRVVIINATMAERFWPGEDVVGKTIVLEPDEDEERITATVVGVVEDVIGGGLYQERGPQIFASLYQEPFRGVFFVARTASAPDDFASTLRQEIWKVDRSLPVSGVRTMDQVLDEAMGPFRGIAGLLVILASGAIILASGGIYGVISYAVGQRMHEFGVRAALGASRRNVLRLVLRQGATLAFIGVGIGLAASFGASRLMAGFLFGVGTGNLVTFVALPMLLIGVALLATYIPAVRATRVDPMRALRYE
jgi:putative ABC transport system permease protein